MGELGGQVWVVLVVVAAVGGLALLHCMAASVRNAAYIHDLRVRVAELRKEHLERLQALAEKAGSEPVGKVGATQPAAAGPTRRAA